MRKFLVGAAVGGAAVYFFLKRVGVNTPSAQAMSLEAAKVSACKLRDAAAALASSDKGGFIGNAAQTAAVRLTAICSGKAPATAAEMAALKTASDDVQASLNKFFGAATGQSGFGCWWCH